MTISERFSSIFKPFFVIFESQEIREIGERLFWGGQGGARAPQNQQNPGFPSIEKFENLQNRPQMILNDSKPLEISF